MKFTILGNYVFPIAVAPLGGAWIEIRGDSVDGGTFTVAPLVGAWIEINVGGHTSGVGCGSLLSWERGLKSDGSFGKHVRFARRSSRGSVD